MNEHDHFTPSPEASEPSTSGPLAGTEDAPGEDAHESNVGVIREGLRRFGEPFLAYLVLDGVEQRSHSLVGEFEEAYVGQFPDRVAFTLEQLEYNNWEGGFEGFLERLGLPGQVVRWDYAELFEHLADSFRVTERLGGLYVFRR